MNIIKPSIDSEEYKSAITVSQMRESDKYTIENFTSGRELMFRAAMGICNSVSWKEKRVAIVCGSGNNAGDGYALAGILADHEVDVTIFRLSEKFSPDGKFYYDIAQIKGVKEISFADDTDFSVFDVVVDCILGTGSRGNPEGIVAVAIEKINESGAYVVCADINSGLDGDTGEARLAVKSDLTVSIGYYKKGMFIGNASEYIGGLMNVDIGIKLI